MRKLLLLAALSMVATFLFASAAFAQQTGPEFCYDGTLDPNYPNCPFYPGIDDPNYPAPSEDVAPEVQYAPETENGTIEFGADPAEAPTSSYTALPDTGGPSLLLPISILLVGTGILGFAAKRRVS